MINFSGVIAQLEAEWNMGGFFYRLRNGDYDNEQAQKILDMLRVINPDENEPLPKRLVSLLWYLPSFLGWQVSRVREQGGDCVAYERFITDVFNTLEEILGTP